MDAESIETARERLAQINGVASVVIDAKTGDIALICIQPIHRTHIEEEARAILDEIAGPDARHALEVTYRAEHKDRARLRFGELRRHAVAGSVRVEVDLEWGDQNYTGTASGEVGSVLEMRTAAQATLSGVTTIIPELDLKLAGVKQVRAFDTELIVVSLYDVENPARKFVGAVVIGTDPLRSAAISVLSALNRVMGNYLSRP